MLQRASRRATPDEPDVAIPEVTRGDGRTLAGRFEPGSTGTTDEHPAYKNPEEIGYAHPVVNRGEGEYASGGHDEIHTDNCECRISCSSGS